MTASRACNYLQNAAATTYKKFLQFYAKRSCKKQTGIPDSTLQNYENGTTPNFSTLEIICEALGTTIAGFFQSDCFSYFTEDQEELMSLFEKMGPDDRQRLLAFADGLASDL